MSTVPSNLVPTSISQLPTIPGVPATTDQLMVVQNGNTYRAPLSSLIGVITVPSSRAIYTGTGLQGGGTLATDLTLSLADTGVTAGTYGSSTQVPILSINSQGQVTNVSTSSFSVSFSSITGKPTTLSGYGITDGQPLNSVLTGLSGVGTTGLFTQTAFGTSTTRSIAAGTGISVSNGNGISGNPTVAISNTGVVAGEYGSATQIPTFIVNDQGQITSIGQNYPSIAWTEVTGTPTTLAGYGITDAVPNTRTVTGQYSITGGGALSSNVVLNLVGDTSSPGNSKYYGTDNVGTRGWYTLSGGGSVTSVGLTMPTDFTVSGSPVTTTGTFSVNYATQGQRKFFAGPTSGADATPTFRLMAATDLPSTAVTADSYGSSSQVGSFTVDAQGRLTAASNVSISFNAISPITSTGDLIVGNGTNSATRLGIGINGTVLTSNGTTAYWTSVPNANASRTTFSATAGQTSFTLTYNPAGIVVVTRNGSNLTPGVDFTATSGTSVVLTNPALGGDDIVILTIDPSTSGGSGSGTVTSVNVSGGTTGLTTSGGPVTTTGTITLAGTLAAANGGTSFTSYAKGDILYASATNTLSKLAVGTNGQVLTLAAGVPTWAASGAGLTIGTTTITGGTSGRILYDSAGVVGELATTGSGSVVLATSPTLITPILGTPTSVTLTNATGLPVGGISATGTPSSSTYLRGDGTWSTVSASITINSTAISGGTTGRILYDNAGTVGELATIPTANGGTNLSSFTSGGAVYATSTSVLTTGTLPVGSGGSGATTLTGILKGNGTSAFTAATAGTDYVAPATATTFTATQTFGPASTAAIVTPNILEAATISATAATGTINIDVLTSSILYYTTNASATFILNVRGSSGTALNAVMATGQTITVVFINTNGAAGATGYYPTAITVDGGTPTLKWLNATVTSGNSGIDMYSLAITKTANATFTVFASQSKFV